jgi:hypothetical protein
MSKVKSKLGFSLMFLIVFDIFLDPKLSNVPNPNKW